MMLSFAGIRRRSMTIWRDGDGATALIVALFLPVIVAFTALAMDMSYAYWTRTQLQHAASAAALAGASQLDFEGTTAEIVGEVKGMAIAYANKNMDPALHGTTLVAADVILGNWDVATQDFTAMGTTGGPGSACDNPQPAETNPNCLVIDAVQATTRRAELNDNPLDLFLGAAIGLAQTDVNTLAIAWAEPGPPPPADTDCYQDGMISGGKVTIQSNNSFTNGYCIFSECQIEIQQNTTFEVGHPLLDEVGNPILDNDGNEIIVPGTQVAVAPENAPGCDPWDATGFPGMKLGDEFGGQNCGLVGHCTPPVCGDLSESQAECAWQGAVPPIPPPPKPELALFWDANMFPNIEDLPSLTPPLSSTADELGAITAVDLSVFTSPEPMTQAELDALLGPEPLTPSTTCQPASVQNKVYVFTDEKADLGANRKICNLVILAKEIAAGDKTTLENVALIAKNPAFGGAKISIASFYNLNHVLLAAKDYIDLASNGNIGDSAVCGGTAPTVQIFAGQNLTVGTDTTVSNADLVAAGSVSMGSETYVNTTGAGTTIQALGDINVASDSTFGGCPEDIIDDANADDPEIAFILRLVD